MTKAKRAAAFIGITVAFAFPAGVAAATECYPTCGPPNGITEVKSETQGSIDTANTSSTSGATLPVTGGDVLGLTLLGGGAIAAGAVLVRRTRKA